MSKTEEKLMIQFQENSRADEMTEGRTEEWMEGQKERWNDGRTDRPYFMGPFWLLPGILKYSCSLTTSFYFPFTFLSILKFNVKILL